MTATTENEQALEAKDKIAIAAGAALLAAGLILVMFVLPAEYGIDPVGTGFSRAATASSSLSAALACSTAASIPAIVASSRQ